MSIGGTKQTQQKHDYLLMLVKWRW